MTTQMEKSPVKPETLAAFKAMWGMHPSPVQLIKANRDIVAVNDVGQKRGVKTGTKCFRLVGNDRICDVCQGSVALKERSARRAVAWQARLNMFIDIYWIPVACKEDLYVRFFNDLTPYAKASLCK